MRWPWPGVEVVAIPESSYCVNVAKLIHVYAHGAIFTNPSNATSPNQPANGIKLGHERVLGATASQVGRSGSRIEVHCAGELACEINVAGGVNMTYTTIISVR